MPTAYTCLGVHIVFSTKGRSPIITDDWRDELHAYIGGTVKGLGGTVFSVGGIEDHVHIAANLPAKCAPADIIRDLKKASSTWAAGRCLGFAWQTGYGAFGFSARERAGVVAYVNGQAEHHRKVSSADELRALLAESGIEWDERFFD
jgi:REP element-mobilizing transposase RayT